MRTLSTALLSMLTCAALAAQAPPPAWRTSEAPAEIRPIIARADSVIAAMQDALITELSRELLKGGPEGAINACHLDAAAVAERLARTQGVAAGRTSHRLRNPSNAPKPWAAAIVKSDAGRRARDVEGYAVDLGDRVGVMRPIAQQPMCAACHGPSERIGAGVRQVLADRYPADRATGFSEGEIRGWFWVELLKPVR